MSVQPTLLTMLKRREYNVRNTSHEQKLLEVVEKKINVEHNGMMKLMNALKVAMKANLWVDIDITFADVMVNILDNDPEQMYNVTDKKAQQRELFVLSGGLQLLLELFAPPFVQKDARLMTVTSVENKSEFFNGLLVVLREVAFVVPSLAEKIFNDDHIVFLFTLLSHNSVFDNTMNLLEEIIATRIDMFNLSLVPNLFDLIDKFNSRTLAHFCRLFSMLLFEPEDRQIIEGTHVLRSTELLRLRRNRMTKTSVNIVERNQTLVINMPGLLERLVSVLRVVNHGPTLHQFMTHNIVNISTLITQTLTFTSGGRGLSDWTHFASLEKIASDPITPPTHNSSSSSSIYNGEQGTAEEAMEDLLHAFSAVNTQPGVVSGHYQHVDVQTLLNVMQLAQDLGVGTVTTLGQAIIASMPPPAQSAPTTAASRRSILLGQNRLLVRARMALNRSDPLRAKKELQFHAMLLATHQIELIFVLCTLLSGRRKVYVQTRLVGAGLGEVLNGMYDRMSWDVPSAAINSPASVMHVHGPNCECNTESAVRVQLLRLIHNFHDRDFLGNSNKLYALTGEEVEALMDSEPHSRRQDDDDDDLIVPQRTQFGLLTKIATTLLSAQSDSVYRFWLSACLENFLRGSGNKAQCFLASLAPRTSPDSKAVSNDSLLNRTLHQVADSDAKAAATLQTAFDLLGEMVKGNPWVATELDRALDKEQFDRFWKLVVNNLVDSNVFLRSVYLLMELLQIDCAVGVEERVGCHGQTMNQFGFYVNSLRSDDLVCLDRVDTVDSATNQPINTARHGYLTHSYVQFAPLPLSSRAMEIFSEPVYERAKKAAKKADKPSDPPIKSAFRNSLATLAEVMGAVQRATSNILSFVDGGGGGDGSDTSDAEPEESSGSSSSSDDELSDLPSLIRLIDEEDGENTSFFGLTGSSLLDVDDGRGGSSSGRRRDFGAELRNVLEGATGKTWKGSKSEKKAKSSSKHVVSISSSVHSRDYHPLADSEKVTQRNAALMDCKLFVAIRADKIQTLLRLMSVVSLDSINHENICCINTALLMMLFDHTRDRLNSVLNEVRQAAEEVHVALNRRDSFDLDNPDDNLDNNALSAMTLTDEQDTAEDRLNGPGALIVMRNFRELLWYWGEYYLRRGRDRLSIEFSSHLPFAQWEKIVGLLCADDGSPCALLSRPTVLAVSPFRRPPAGMFRPQDGEVINR